MREFRGPLTRMSKSKWNAERVVDVPQSFRFKSIEAYRWDRLALYLDIGRQVPGHTPDDEIDDAINTKWLNRFYLCDPQ